MKENCNSPDYVAPYFEECTGKSETIPNQALHIGDIMLRSLRGAVLPEVENNHLEYGDDENFDDAFDNEQDLTDIFENRSYIESVQERIKNAKKSKQPPINSSETEKKTESEELPSPKSE